MYVKPTLSLVRQHNQVIGRPLAQALQVQGNQRIMRMPVSQLFEGIARQPGLVGFAKLQMASDLAFSDAVYGFGAGVFFIGYFLFEVPSNLLLQKIGAKKTIMRITIGWGLTSIAMMFVKTPEMFYFLRFLLGVFEAGFYPGIILYLTYWFPNDRRAKAFAVSKSPLWAWSEPQHT